MYLLALRSVFRHRVRTLLTLAAVAFGVVSLILSGGFVEDIFIKLQEMTIHSRLGHLQIYRAGYSALGRRNPYNYLMENSNEIYQVISDMPEVSDVLLRLSFSGLANNGRADLPVIVEGIQPEKEERLGTSLVITRGRQLTKDDVYGILVGEGVARALQINPGDYLTLLANTTDGVLNSLDFELVGIFRTFARDYDNHAVRIPLESGQDLVGTSGMHSIVLSLHHTDNTDYVASNIGQKISPDVYEVKTWYELADFYKKTVKLYRTQFGVLQFIILFMVILSVTNSINMSVHERVGEFGTLMAIGQRRNDIFFQVVKENVVLGLLGACVGTLAGLLLAWLISRVGISMPPPPNSEVGYTAHIRVMPGMVAMAFVVGAGATVLSSLMPAYRVARIPVAVALRQNV